MFLLKKIKLIILISVISLLFTISCGTSTSKNTLNIGEYSSKTNAFFSSLNLPTDKPSLIYIGSKGCPYCREFVTGTKDYMIGNKKYKTSETKIRGTIEYTNNIGVWRQLERSNSKDFVTKSYVSSAPGNEILPWSKDSKEIMLNPEWLFNVNSLFNDHIIQKIKIPILIWKTNTSATEISFSCNISLAELSKKISNFLNN